MPPNAAGSISTDKAARLARAFAALKYDLFVLAPEDRTTLDQGKIPGASAWLTVDEKPRVVTKKVPDGHLAFILFPPAGQNNDAAALVEMARDLRASGAPGGRPWKATFSSATARTSTLFSVPEKGRAILASTFRTTPCSGCGRP